MAGGIGSVFVDGMCDCVCVYVVSRSLDRKGTLLVMLMPMFECQGMTTNEAFKREDFVEGEKDKEMENVYNLGIARNFKDVFFPEHFTSADDEEELKQE